jgi:hypothetical protein
MFGGAVASAWLSRGTSEIEALLQGMGPDTLLGAKQSGYKTLPLRERRWMLRSINSNVGKQLAHMVLGLSFYRML